jgi:hypothetical protein
LLEEAGLSLAGLSLAAGLPPTTSPDSGRALPETPFSMEVVGSGAPSGATGSDDTGAGVACQALTPRSCAAFMPAVQSGL